MTDRAVFLASVHRCLEREGFAASFYTSLLAESEEIRHRFRFTRMGEQVERFTRALHTCADAAEGKPEALAEIARLAVSHDRDHNDIPPEWYPIWLETLIATARRWDRDWTPAVETAWRNVLRHVINRMAEKY